jgi:hypothetical protein
MAADGGCAAAEADSSDTYMVAAFRSPASEAAFQELFKLVRLCSIRPRACGHAHPGS